MASTGLTPIMEEDQDKSNIQINAESSSTELNASPQQKDPLAAEKSPEPKKEKDLNKDSSLDKKGPRGKGWLLFLTLIITLGIGFYFYTNKKDEDSKKFFFTSTKTKNTLDSALEKTPLIPIQEIPKKIEVTSSLDTQLNEMPIKSEKEVVEEESFSGTKLNETSGRSSEKEVVDGENSLDIQPKGIPSKLSGEITERTKTTNPFGQTINENKKTINLLREEIKSLKSELKENSSTSQKLGAKNPNTTAGVLEESISKTIALSKTSLSTKTQPLIRKNHPQRSKEVQAYLDFIENAGRNFFEIIKDGWGRLKRLAIELIKKY
ncbi:uncharacterized protein METZ01_LOCUS102171 [marine metagenome]|uniref:Uncharacterized protein n=1 Tax=marine metagenome TaxID=408172 RepID=A0A381WBJ5_9ZZZZ